MIRIAFGSVPKDGGTFTFYRNLRPALLQKGIDMRCVALGKQQALLWEDAYVDDGCVLLSANTRNIKKQAQAFVKWCEQQRIDIVMAINSEAILSSLPHLPERIRVLSRCANAFDHGYRITMSGKERFARIIALTPRLQKDLVEQYGADPSIMHLIPNGINPAPFDAAAQTSRGTNPELRLGFLGRLEHNQKGIFHLPDIVKALNDRNIPFNLHIAGKGRHQAELEKRLSLPITEGQVQLLGTLPPNKVPEFLVRTDIFLFPSHFEGCPNALLEALMAGCVPVSWRIEGITDFVLEEGRIGYLFETGDYAAVANCIAALHHNRKQVAEMSRRAATAARQRFTSEIAARHYSKLIIEVMKNPAPKWTPKPWNTFVINENFDHTWTEYLPPTLRKLGQKIKKSYNK